MNTTEWLKRYDESVAGVLPKCFDLVIKTGHGSWIWDIDDRAYLDFTSGIAVTNVGHCNPHVVRAIKNQAETLLHTSVVARHQGYIELAEKLGDKCPFFEEPRAFFCNSGAEAVDGALKLARRVTGSSGVIAFQGAFHGRTVAATALTTAKTKYRTYNDLADWAYTSLEYGTPVERIARTIDMSRTAAWAKHKIGAVIVEPVLGEGGYIVPPDGWLAELRQLCTETGTLLIFDEVQTGAGRTGSFTAAETFSVRPDVLLLAKGLASGLPIGAIIAEKTLMDQWPTGSHGSTFGGNPLSCAAGLATLEVLDLCYENVHQLGVYARDRLSQSLPYPVRGVGLMIGIECPSGAFVEAVQERCKDKGLLVLSCGTHGEVLRLMPPLNIEFDELSNGLRILIDVILDLNT